jgi:hypothetical protein
MNANDGLSTEFQAQAQEWLEELDEILRKDQEAIRIADEALKDS